MKSQILRLAAHVLVFSAMSASAAIRYVNVNSTNPAPPYTNWTTAATNIQDGVDAAVAGDQILVTNGVYQGGTSMVLGTWHRVAVNKAVKVQSVNGAAVTLIQGHHAMRCVYLANGAALVGFTLTNGVAEFGGAVLCESTNAVLSNCVLTGNSATGSFGNRGWGGGAYGGALNNCTIIGNTASASGGGASGGTLSNCTLSGNSARGSSDFGGGGGASDATLNNCTLSGNTSADNGGGAIRCKLNNCIVYYNNAPNGDNYSASTLRYSCTTPLPPEGLGNISAEPELADLFHLSASSPCRGAGTAAYATGLDIDGQTWANPPSIGCDEYYPSVLTGPLSVSIQADYTNVIMGFAVNFTAAIDGRANANRWDFGDGTVVSNRPYASHSWATTGDYLVVLQAYNDIYPGGVSATVTVHVVAQPVHYVALSSANPVAPYTSWATAANSIQAAVDSISAAGALVLVTNGIYQTGGRVVFGAMTNRVAVNKPVTVQSVNGAEVTVIRGFQVPGTTNGDSAIRCVYLTNGAALVGFTLTNGATRAEDSGDYQREQSGGGVWCESASGVVSNCTLTGNSASYGGGADLGTLNNSTLTGNYASSYGGGATQCTLNNCTLTGNSAGTGGGALGCRLNNCTLTGNSAGGDGGGVGGGRLNNCTLSGNSAGRDGGGATQCTLNNCMLSGNSAGLEGGGAYDATLNNCTLSGNLAGREGGGASAGTLSNCIVYYNTALLSGDNYSSDISFSYSCTTPLPSGGEGNISAEPQLASASHLSAGSPCRGSGSPAYATGVDIDGETWANPPSMGCDEYHPGAVTGPLSVTIQAAYTNVIVGLAVNFTASIDGRATGSRWEFGDGTVVSNQSYTSHSWAIPGDYSVILQSYNETYPGAISSTVTVQVVAQPVHYVALASPRPAAPYTSWATAANNIQDAVDAALVAGALVLVTNGVYQTGGRAAPEFARVAVTKPLVLRSINGAAVTVIQGNGGVRCVYLANGAALMGFTLTKGAGSPGGGVWCESRSAVVSDCVLTGNLGGISGGGASGGTLNNCTLKDNSANLYGQGGGGASFCTLNNCTLTGNSADGNRGGGAIFCTLNNCIVYYNSAPIRANYSDSVLSYSCTTPLPTDRMGNLTNAPLFVDYTGGNLRLQSDSPCINAGANAFAPAGPDLDGNPRVAGGTVDVGAYEFQSPQSLISYAWLQQYNLPTDGSADVTDADGDGLNNWQEWHAGTNPTNALSALRLLSPASGASGVIVSWQSVNGLNYLLERGTDLGAQPSFLPLANNIVGQAGTTTFTDTNAAGASPFFYRVGVQE